MGLYRAEGIVLRTHKLGESDRIVSVLTREHGKVRAVAKGVRKTKSCFGARLEPPTHIQLQLYEGRSELHIVDQAETIDHRSEEHTSELQSLMRISYAVFCLKKKKNTTTQYNKE